MGGILGIRGRGSNRGNKTGEGKSDKSATHISVLKEEGEECNS